MQVLLAPSSCGATYRSLGTVCRVAASHGQQRRGERGTGGHGLEEPHQDLRPLYESEHQEHNNKQRKCPDGSEEAGEHVAVLLLHRRVKAQLVYEKEDEARRPEPAEANPQPEGRLLAPGERVRDSVRHAKRERGQDEVDEGGVPHEPVDSRMVLAGGALPQEHAHEEGEAIEGERTTTTPKKLDASSSGLGHVSGERLEGNMGPPWGWTWSERGPNEELMRPAEQSDG